MKTLVLYQSRYGFSKTYAEWLAEALHADLLPLEACSPKKAAPYACIILGGGLYAGRASWLTFFTKNFSSLNSKRLLVFFVGLNVPNEEGLKKICTANGCTRGLVETASFFALRGGIDFSKLSLHHRLMMNMLYFVLNLKRNKSPEEQSFLKDFHLTKNFASKEALAPLLKAAQF